MSDAGQGPRRPGRREQVLDVLRQATEPMSIVAVADALGIHPNTARLHLEALAARGRLDRVDRPPPGPGRPPRLFRYRGGMDPDGPRDYALLAGILADGLAADPEASGRAVESGRAWGRRLVDARPARRASGDPTDRLVDLLDDLGFAPERRAAEGRAQIGLRNCPFLALTAEHRGVVCPVHLGLMQGAMERIGGEVVASLDPFVEPDLCVTHLGAGQEAPR